MNKQSKWQTVYSFYKPTNHLGGGEEGRDERKKHRDEKKQKYQQQLDAVDNQLQKTGHSFFFHKGKIMARGKTKEDTIQMLTKEIQKEPTNYHGELVTSVTVSTHPHRLLDNDIGCVQINVVVNRIQVDGEDFAYFPATKSHSSFQIYLFANELHEFKVDSLAKIAQVAELRKFKDTTTDFHPWRRVKRRVIRIFKKM